MNEHRWLDPAYAILRREIPGRWDRLRAHLAEAPVEVQQEFFRVLQQFERMLNEERDKARHPWRR